MALKGGRSEFEKKKGLKGPYSKPGSGHTLRALVRLRREPVKELIKIADATENVDLKIALWKYLNEQRDRALELLGAVELNASKGDLDALEKDQPAPVAEQAR